MRAAARAKTSHTKMNSNAQNAPVSIPEIHAIPNVTTSQANSVTLPALVQRSWASDY